MSYEIILSPEAIDHLSVFTARQRCIILDAIEEQLSQELEMAAKGTVIITQDNKPVFAFVSVNEEDLQTWQLGENPEFLEIMRYSWDRLKVEGGVSLAEAKRRLLNDRT
jgi:hypothetical protein